MTTDSRKKPADYTGVIIAAILAPVYLIFYILGQEELGRSVFIVLGMTMLAIRVRWDLRNRFWFWAVIVLVLALHVPLLFFVRWPQGYHGWLPAIGTLPIGLADVLIILGVVRFVEKFFVKFPPTEEARSNRKAALRGGLAASAGEPASQVRRSHPGQLHG